MWKCGLKPDGNDELRQKWLGKIIPVVRKLGVRVTAEQATAEPDGTWSFTMPDWVEVKRVIRNGGPASQQRLDWVRRTLVGNAALRHALRETP